MFTHSIKHAGLVLTLTAIGLVTTPTFAEEPPKPSADDFQVIKISRKCGNRSLHGSYRNANEAIQAAEQLRREPTGYDVEIVKGVSDKPLPAMPICTYEVYRNSCKGYSLHRDYRSLHDPVAAAAELMKVGDKVEIVTRYGRN